jgi:hypothetical protein
LVAPAATTTLWRRGIAALVFQALVVLVQEYSLGWCSWMPARSGVDLRERVDVFLFCSIFG